MKSDSPLTLHASTRYGQLETNCIGWDEITISLPQGSSALPNYQLS